MTQVGDPPLTALQRVLAASGETGEQTLALDWSATPIGPMQRWTPCLCTALGICASSRFPMVLLWGEQLVLLYNDAYRAVLGGKHPWALGRPLQEAWHEIWPVLGPMLGDVRQTGEATWSDDQMLLLERNGYSEEAYFRFSHSPVWDEGAVAGIFTAVTETTSHILANRRLRTLRNLADRREKSGTVGEALATASAVIAENPLDIPFALAYMLSEDGREARLADSAGVPGIDHGRAVALADGDGWPLQRVLRTGTSQVVAELPEHIRPSAAAHGGIAPRSAIAHALVNPESDRSTGVLITGVSPRRALDDDYRSFLELVADQVQTAIVEAQTYEAERERAEALAELDRSKTTFFSNVSHEFRTPLTLILGPIGDALADEQQPLGARQRARIDTASRNADRLLKLVNVLLDFSRLEAGRMEAAFEPTDLASLTSDLASVFRSAAERAGLLLVVDCPPLGEDVYVDRDMWEKIVLNLLSNALKFTFEGQIVVSLRLAGTHAQLRVTDTGTGIPQPDLAHVFERFHRVRDARARSDEGTGIGLALVRELAELHGGDVAVDSEVGRGTTFTVTAALGSAHLPQDHVQAPRALPPTPADPRAYLDEALRWLPDVAAATEAPPPASPTARILVVDDNADMRDYLRDLLSGHWGVEVARDGDGALAAALTRPPDLVLADVMMPGRDGLQLLRELRADARTASVPVILLSARAGEEPPVEGLTAGADDYLLKPFSAAELLARVRVHLSLAQARADAAEAHRESAERERESAAMARFRMLAEMTSDIVGIADGAGRTRYVNAAGRRALGYDLDADLTDVPMTDYVDPGSVPWFQEVVVPAAVRYGIWRGETRLQRTDGRAATVSQVVVAHRGDDGEVDFFATIARDITAERDADARLRAAEERFRSAFEDAPVGMAMLDAADRGPRAILRANPALCRLTGCPAEVLRDRPLESIVHPDDRGRTALSLDRLARGELSMVSVEVRLVRGDGELVQAAFSASASDFAGGRRELLLHVQDMRERKRFEDRLQQLADHDPLTGLLNRRRFGDELEREVAAVRRYGRSGALLVLDLDDFKVVNDSLGHVAGDELLVRAAQQLRRRLRESDTLARLGGDEFAAIIPYADESAARRVAEGMLRALSESVQVASTSGARRLTASVGIALMSDADVELLTSEELLVQADIAMYDAKAAGRNSIAVFDPHGERQRGMERRLGWAQRIRDALDDDRLVLHAQPIIGLAGDDAPRHELLVRMRAEDGELIEPGAFLEVAEHFELIQAIDRRVVREAIALLAAAQVRCPDVSLEVNLSAKSLLDPGLPDAIADEIAASGADAGGLVFEVTETAAVVNFDEARHFARRLAELGCRFALDDFGAGYCSFHYIKRLAFDYLKIDGEFVKELATSDTNQLIVRAVVDIARGLGKKTVAEFVDSAETLELLRSYGVDYAQGYHIARPAPVELLDLARSGVATR